MTPVATSTITEVTSDSWRTRLQTWSWLVTVAITALIARILYWVLVTPNYRTDSDAAHYEIIAKYIASGDGFQIKFPTFDLHQTAFRPPLYPYVLGGTYRVFGDQLVVGRALSLVVGVAVAALAALLISRIATRRAGLIAGLCVALYPPLLANDTAILTEGLSLLLLVGILLLLVDRRWILAGGLCGLLVLTRTSAQFLIPIVALWLLWQIGWKRALGFVGIAVIVVSPWVVRNWVVMGSPVLNTSNGFNAAAIYSPEAIELGGFVDPAIDQRFKSTWLLKYDEVAWSKKLQSIAWDSVKQHPTYVVTVIGRNLTTYLELKPSENDLAETFDGRQLGFRRAMLPLFYIVTLIGVAGLIIRRREPIVALMIALGAYFTVASLLFVGPPRLRTPFDFFCCLGVGLAVDWFLQSRSTRRSIMNDGVDVTPSESLQPNP